MNTANSIVWLHLSDLHLCEPKNGWDAGRVLGPLIPDLKRMEKAQGLSPSFIFFTGDAAYGQIGRKKGESLRDQFEQVYAFLEGVRTAFEREVPRENLFLVPGNHDVDRTFVTQDQVLWREKPPSVEEVTEHIRQADRLWLRHMERLRAYGRFLDRHGYRHLLEDPRRLIYAAVRTVNGINVGICGLNTAWSSCADKEKGSLWMAGDWQIGELARRLQNVNKTLDVRIALAHHPLGWFNEHEDPALRPLIEREFQFFLHGHEHQGWVRDSASGHVCIAAGACYDRANEPNGYNFVRLAFGTNEKEVWVRQYDSANGCWAPRPAPGGSDDGRWPLGSQPTGVRPQPFGARPQPSWQDSPFPPSRLSASCEHFAGREDDLDRLERAWASGDPNAAPPKQNLFCIVAWGGVGKTTLVGRFVARLSAARWHGAERFFDWSFHGQGASEKTANADQFLDAALRWFGESNPERLIGWAKGARLAALIATQRTLLVLDGLEPLQEPGGTLSDNAMQALIRGLAAHNPGLCIITTRVAVPDLTTFEGHSCVRHTLQHLEEDAGVRLLRELGVTKSSGSELRRAVRAFRGHALSLTLLGSYSAAVNNGRIDQTKLGAALQDFESAVRHMMEPYEDWLEGRPESDVLHVLGLFNQPADGAAIRALRESPVILGLTGKVCGPGHSTKWDHAVYALRRLHMLDPRDEANPEMLDCHPLVREHFRAHLRAAHPDAWIEGHRRLYEHFKQAPARARPDTLAEMQPLFRAVAHGCYAGLHAQAMEEVYWDRIMREEEHYSTQTLGAYGADQEALSAFFEIPWTKPASGLPGRWPGDVLIWAGEHLRAAGRLSEAEEPMRASLEMAIEEKLWADAAPRAEILCDLLLTIGKLEEAVRYGRQSVDLADRSDDSWQQGESRTTLAESLRENDCLEEARRLFKEVEESRKRRKPERVRPFSVGVFRFCYLLLAQGHFAEAREYARHAIEVAQKEKFLLGMALGDLVLGRADLLEARQVSGEAGSAEALQALYGSAEKHLDSAVLKLREANTEHELPRGLVARAALRRMEGRFADAWRDLAETEAIAERGQMKLHLANVHIEAARLFRDVQRAALRPADADAIELLFSTLPDAEKGDRRGERSALAAQCAARQEEAAKSLIKEMNYKRAQRELEALRKTWAGGTRAAGGKRRVRAAG